MLKERDIRVLQIIARRIDVDGFAPSIKEIAEEVGVKSDYAVLQCLLSLEREGYIRRHAKIARGIRIARREPNEAHAARLSALMRSMNQSRKPQKSRAPGAPNPRIV